MEGRFEVQEENRQGAAGCPVSKWSPEKRLAGPLERLAEL